MGDMIAVFKYIKGCHKGMVINYSPWPLGEGQEEIIFICGKVDLGLLLGKRSNCEGGETLEQAA